MRYVIYILFLTLFVGCAPKVQIERSQSYLVTFKTKKFAYRDTGFLKKADGYLNLQIFAMGNLLMNLTLDKRDDRVCINRYCFDKDVFNQTYLSRYYPHDILENILNSRAIFKGKNLKETKRGFIQKIKKSKKYDIKYIVTDKRIFFKDTLNKIIVSLKSL